MLNRLWHLQPLGKRFYINYTTVGPQGILADKTKAMIKHGFYWLGLTGDAKCCVNHVILVLVGNLVLGWINLHYLLYHKTENDKYIMIVRDYFAKWTEVYSILKHTAPTIADKLVTEF